MQYQMCMENVFENVSKTFSKVRTFCPTVTRTHIYITLQNTYKILLTRPAPAMCHARAFLLQENETHISFISYISYYYFILHISHYIICICNESRVCISHSVIRNTYIFRGRHRTVTYHITYFMRSYHIFHA
jgi:hypothetical protein